MLTRLREKCDLKKYYFIFNTRRANNFLNFSLLSARWQISSFEMPDGLVTKEVRWNSCPEHFEVSDLQRRHSNPHTIPTYDLSLFVF